MRMNREGREGDESSTYNELYTVDVVEREDGLYVFGDLEDARRFEDAVKSCSHAAVRDTEVVNDSTGTDVLIRAEVEAAGEVMG